MAYKSYGLFPEEEVYFQCSLRDADHGHWESVLAISPLKAARKFYEMLDEEYQTPKAYIYVLRPGENPGVDKAIEFRVDVMLIATGS